MRLAERMGRIAASSTLAVLNEAARLRASGVDVVDLGAGEPDFPTPENIREAAKRAIDAGFTKYTPAQGVAELRRAIASKYAHDYHADVKPSQVIATAGGKQAIFNALLALVDEGDEVVIPAPCWVTFPEVVRFAGGTPVYVEREARDGFAFDAERIAAAISDRTRLIIINSPCNPTGAVADFATIERLARLAAERNIYLLSDECYGEIVYDGARPMSAASLASELRARTLVVGTLSKSYAMTGWRLGYAIAPEPLVEEMLKIQSHSTSNPTSMVQHAAIEALNGPQDQVKAMVAEFERRRNYLIPALNSLPAIKCPMPRGAFYAFPDISAYTKRNGISGSNEFCRRLIAEAHVAVTPGSAFGADGFIRISYAASMERLVEGVGRLRAFLAGL